MEPLEILTYLVWLAASVTFIFALKFLASPRTARQGNLLGAAGMALIRERRLAWHAWLLRLPVIGPLRHRFATARVARTLSALLGSGTPALGALGIAREATGDRDGRPMGPLREVVRGPIVLHHEWVIDRDVRGSLLEFRNGIPSRRHHRPNQAVRLDHRTRRIIDEPSLSPLPLGCEMVTFLISQRPNMERLDPLFPPAEFLGDLVGFGLTGEPLVFGPVLGLQSLGAAPAQDHPGQEPCGSNDDDKHDPHQRVHRILRFTSLYLEKKSLPPRNHTPPRNPARKDIFPQWR